jgi:carboxymethylenebutenolidase
MSFKKPLREQAEAVFAARKEKPDFLDYEFKDYKGVFYSYLDATAYVLSSSTGTCHGFAARPNLAIPEIVEAYKGALDQTAAWFQKTLQ